MSSLFGTLSLAVRALQAEQGALDATANNVANANTPGYSRQRPVLVQGDPITLASVTYGSGVVLQRLESLRDPILQIRIQEETQQQGQLDSFVSGMNQIQAMFNGNSGNDLGVQFSNFFASLNQLSTDPSNLSLRQGVLTAGGNLAKAFQTMSQNLTSQRQNLDLSVKEAVQQVNVLTGQIATLNGQITSLTNVHEDASTLIDQRDVLIGQLSGLVDVSSIQSDNGLTLTTSNGTPLVAGQVSFTMTTHADPSGVYHIFSQGADITSKLSSGSLAGMIQVRDQKIPDLLSKLDSLAAGFANTFNTAHQAGYDLSGTRGGDFFVPPPASGSGAAASMAVQITNPSAVAASSDGSSGSNGNVATLAAVHDQPIVAGQTATDYYANLVFGVGSDVSNGTAEQSASQLILNQLQDQRGSISGVSLDEEAANLILYQRAYEAAARVISTVNDILDTTINLGRY
jgi:flagellar hook-associated protein 1 FlgK